MITVNMDKAKRLAHSFRRAKRAEEFAPLDEVIMKQIPVTDVSAVETQRQTIRDKYATIQSSIDTAADVAALTTIVEELK